MMTVRQMRIRAKSHGLTGYSRMCKAELVTLLNSIRHQVGDRVVRAIDNAPGIVVDIEHSTFEGIAESNVIVQFDDEPRTTATLGAHHAFVFVSRPSVQDECAKIDATSKLHAEGTQVTLTATREHGEVIGHTLDTNSVMLAHVQLKNGRVAVRPENEFEARSEKCTTVTVHAAHGACKGIRGVADMCLRSFGAYGACVQDKNHASKCRDAFGHEFIGVVSLDKVEDLSKLDFMDLTHMVSVLNEFISEKGREDLYPIADKLDAFEYAADYRGGDSRIPGAIGCECTHESERCSTCVLNKLSRLFGFELDTTEPVDVRPLISAMYVALDHDCYA